MEFLETSGALQALYGLSSGKEEWSKLSSDISHSPFLHGRLNEPAALLTSRLLVRQYYGLGCGDSNHNKSVARNILEKATCCVSELDSVSSLLPVTFQTLVID